MYNIKNYERLNNGSLALV